MDTSQKTTRWVTQHGRCNTSKFNFEILHYQHDTRATSTSSYLTLTFSPSRSCSRIRTPTKFPAEITGLCPALVKATLAVQKAVGETFRKTATNFHYEFNVRHLASVFSGMLMASAARFKTAEKVVFQWVHECERVYGDRLVSPENLASFQGEKLTARRPPSTIHHPPSVIPTPVMQI